MTSDTLTADLRGLMIVIGEAAATRSGLDNEQLIEEAHRWCSEHRMELASLDLPAKRAIVAASVGLDPATELKAALARNGNATYFLRAGGLIVNIIRDGLDQQGQELVEFLRVLRELIDSLR